MRRTSFITWARGLTIFAALWFAASVWKFPVSGIIIASAAVVLSQIFFYIARDWKRSGIPEESGGIPLKYRFLFNGSIFAVNGAMFAALAVSVMPENSGRTQALIPSIVCLILGLFLLYKHFRNYMGR